MEATPRFGINCRLKLREEGEGGGNDDATMAKQSIAIANFNMQDWPTRSRLSYLAVQKFKEEAFIVLAPNVNGSYIYCFFPWEGILSNVVLGMD